MAAARPDTRRLFAQLNRQRNRGDVLGPVDGALKVIAQLVPPDEQKDSPRTEAEPCNAVSGSIDVDERSANRDGIRRRDEHVCGQRLTSDIELLVVRMAELASIQEVVTLASQSARNGFGLPLRLVCGIAWSDKAGGMAHESSTFRAKDLTVATRSVSPDSREHSGLRHAWHLEGMGGIKFWSKLGASKHN